ncbi:MAG: hypothetical protein ACYC9S_03815 [Leptospirales bacterium]
MEIQDSVISKTDLTTEIPNGYVFIASVWGSEFVDLFLNVSMRSLFSPRNLPVVKERTGCSFLIYTKSEFLESIKNSITIKKTEEIMPVFIIAMDCDITNPYIAMSQGHRFGLMEANLLNAAAVFLFPDHIYADGYIESLVRWSENGYRIVTAVFLRANKEKILLKIHEQFSFSTEEPITLKPRELMKLVLDNLHCINKQSFFSYTGKDFVPSNMFWNVGEQGEILAHCYHQAPLLVFPDKKKHQFDGSIDDDLVVSIFKNAPKEYIVTDSDELCAVDLCPMSRKMHTDLCAKYKQILSWANRYTNSWHRILFSHPIRFHFGASSEDAWLKASNTASTIVSRLKKDLSISLAVVFWGGSRLFLDVCVASLLSPGNLGSFKSGVGNRLIIVTTLEDWDLLTKEPVFQKLSVFFRVCFLELNFLDGGFLRDVALRRGRKPEDDGRVFVSPKILLEGYTPAEIRDHPSWNKVPSELFLYNLELYIMAHARRLAAEEAFSKGTNLLFLTPNMIVRDGMLENLMIGGGGWVNTSYLRERIKLARLRINGTSFYTSDVEFKKDYCQSILLPTGNTTSENIEKSLVRAKKITQLGKHPPNLIDRILEWIARDELGDLPSKLGRAIITRIKNKVTIFTSKIKRIVRKINGSDRVIYEVKMSEERICNLIQQNNLEQEKKIYELIMRELGMKKEDIF